jgi:hypothetical protein
MASLLFAHAAGAPPLRAQERVPGSVRIGAPSVPSAASAARLPRLLEGGPATTRAGGRPAGGEQGWGAPFGWSPGWSGGAAGMHPTPRRPARRVQPLVVFVWPYASVYASSSALAGCTSTSAVIASCATAAPRTDDDTVARRAVRTKVIEVAPAPDAHAGPATVAVEFLRDDVLRLRWTGGDSTVREVELVVADSARRILASQRVHAPPYTAVFARDARTALVGVSVLRADGTSTLSLAPVATATPRRD